MFGMLTIRRQVILDINHLEKDYIIKSPAHLPTALSSVVFVSDIPRSWTHNSAEIEPVTTDSIIRQLPLLPHLETLHIRRAQWLSTKNVETILSGCLMLKHINFLGSGNITVAIDSGAITESSDCWAICGSKKKVAKRLRLALRSKA